MQYFRAYVDNATRDRRVFTLKTRDAVVKATDHYLNHYLDRILGGEVSVTRIRSDGAGELGRSGKLLKMLAKRGIRWRSSPLSAPQSNDIAEQAIKKMMTTARSKLLKSGRGESTGYSR